MKFVDGFNARPMTVDVVLNNLSNVCAIFKCACKNNDILLALCYSGISYVLYAKVCLYVVADVVVYVVVATVIEVVDNVVLYTVYCV